MEIQNYKHPKWIMNEMHWRIGKSWNDGNSRPMFLG